MTMYEVMTRGEMPFDKLEDKQVIEVLLAALRRADNEQRPLVLAPPPATPARLVKAYTCCIDIQATKRPDFGKVAELLSPYSATEPLFLLEPPSDVEESHL